MYVQYGCGFSAAQGWLNFDASPTLRFERLPVVGRLYTKNATRFPDNVRYGDIVRGLPVAPDSVDGLYASHVLEHLSRSDCRRALANSFRILRPGGTFRLIVPDLKARAARYVQTDGPDAAHAFMEGTYLGTHDRPRGVMGMAALLLGNSQHLWMWDEASMSQELSDAGFVHIRRCSFGDSTDPMFARVEEEGRFVDTGLVEVALEARKPVP